MSRGKRFESARRLFTTGLDKPHGRNWRSPRFVLEAAPIGGQPFAQDISRRDCTAFLLLFDTYDTRLLAQALRRLPNTTLTNHRGHNTLQPTGDLRPLAYPAEVQVASPGERPLFVRSRRGVGEERGRRDAARGGVSSPLCRPWGRAAALRRGGRGTARVGAARLPAVLVPVEAPGPGAGRGRLPGGFPGHARLQPLGQTARSASIPR